MDTHRWCCKLHSSMDTHGWYAISCTINMHISSNEHWSTLLQSMPIQSDPIRSDPIRSDPIRSDPIRSDPIQFNPIRSDPIQSNSIQSNPTPFWRHTIPQTDTLFQGTNLKAHHSTDRHAGPRHHFEDTPFHRQTPSFKTPFKDTPPHRQAHCSKAPI